MREEASWRRRGVLASALLAAVWAAVLLWPVLRAPSRTIPMDPGDPVLNATILQWNATRVPLTEGWWNFPSYVPSEGVTTFTEHLLGLWPLASPVIWITGDPILAYNLVLYLSFVLSAATLAMLVRDLTGSSAAALVAGTAFAFNAYRIGQLPHLQMLMTWGMPLALVGLHRYLAAGRPSALVLFGIGWLVTALSNGYFMVFFAVFVAAWIAWFCSTAQTSRRLPGIAAAGAIASLPLAPILIEYVRVHARYGFARAPTEVRSYAADVSGLFLAHPYAALASRWLPGAHAEGALFPGAAVLLLGAAGLACGVSAPAAASRSRWLARASLAGIVLFGAAALVAATTDLRIGGPIRLSISSPHKPLTGLLICLVVFVAASRRIRGAIAARNVPLFYGLMALLMWLLSLGPEARLFGEQVLYQPPYFWLMKLPGVQGLRVPARFWMLGVMALCVLAGYAVAALRRHRTAAAAALVVVLLAEGWGRIVAADVPAAYGPRPSTADAVVLELPFGSVAEDVAAQFRGVMGGYRTLNGYSGYHPPQVLPLLIGLGLRDGAVLTEVRRLLPLHVSVIADDSDRYRSWLTSTQTDARFVGEAAGRALYFLSKLPPSPADRRAEPIAFTVRGASCSAEIAPQVADGRLDTRWECGPAQPGQQITVDLGRATEVSAVGLALGRFTGDAPRNLLIEASEDGASWRRLWAGLSAGHAVRAIITDPARVEMRFGFPAAAARYLRLTQTGDAMEWYWSVAELAVYAPPLETAAARAGCCRASSAGSDPASSRGWPAPRSASAVSFAAR